MVKYIQFNVYDAYLAGGNYNDPLFSATGHANVTFVEDNYTIGANTQNYSSVLTSDGSGTDGEIRREDEMLGRTTLSSVQVPVTDEQYSYLFNYAQSQEGNT